MIWRAKLSSSLCSRKKAVPHNLTLFIIMRAMREGILRKLYTAALECTRGIEFIGRPIYFICTPMLGYFSTPTFLFELIIKSRIYAFRLINGR